MMKAAEMQKHGLTLIGFQRDGLWADSQGVLISAQKEGIAVCRCMQCSVHPSLPWTAALSVCQSPTSPEHAHVEKKEAMQCNLR